MANRLSWWMIPASVVVLVRVVTLPVDSTDPEPSAPAPLRAPVVAPTPLGEMVAPVEAAFPTGPVLLRDATGERIGPVSLAGRLATHLRVPESLVGETVEFRIGRDDGTEVVPGSSVTGSTRVRSGATIPFLGLEPGRYRVTVQNVDGWLPWFLDGEVEAGGTVDLR